MGVSSAPSVVRGGTEQVIRGVSAGIRSTPGKAEGHSSTVLTQASASTPGRAERAFIHELTQASASTPGKAERAYAARMGRE